jgi:hypothetical protein
MNGDGFHQKILGAPAGLAIPKQMGNMMQSLEFTFFFVRCPKSQKNWCIMDTPVGFWNVQFLAF